MTTNIIENFKLDDHLRDCEIITEQFDDTDGSIFTIRHKALKLGKQLILYLYDSGQATLEYRGREIETFMWDDEAASLFENFFIISAVELFETIHRKRWRSIFDESN